MLKTAMLTALLATAAVPAAAVTVDVSQTYPYGANSGASFQLFTTTFNLPAGFTNAMLNLGSGAADDASVVQINGTNIVGFGIFGPGDGYFYFDPNAAATPYHFDYNNGPINASFAGPFVVGQNTISFYLNNNNAGINTGNGPLTGGPVQLVVDGTVTYDVASGAVPEPAGWAMMIGGLGLVGGALRRRPRPVVRFA